MEHFSTKFVDTTDGNGDEECFFCLQNSREPKSDFGGGFHAFSFRNLHCFLNLLERDSDNRVNEKEKVRKSFKDDFRVPVCAECYQTTAEFDQLFNLLEETKLRLNSCVQKMQNMMTMMMMMTNANDGYCENDSRDSMIRLFEMKMKKGHYENCRNFMGRLRADTIDRIKLIFPSQNQERKRSHSITTTETNSCIELSHKIVGLDHHEDDPLKLTDDEQVPLENLHFEMEGGEMEDESETAVETEAIIKTEVFQEFPTFEFDGGGEDNDIESSKSKESQVQVPLFKPPPEIDVCSRTCSSISGSGFDCSGSRPKCNYCDFVHVSSTSIDMDEHLVRYHPEHYFPEECDHATATASGMKLSKFQKVVKDTVFPAFISKGRFVSCALCSKKCNDKIPGKTRDTIRKHLVINHRKEVRARLRRILKMEPLSLQSSSSGSPKKEVDVDAVSKLTCSYCGVKNSNQTGLYLHQVRLHPEHFFSEERAKVSGMNLEQFQQILRDKVFFNFMTQAKLVTSCSLCSKKHSGNLYNNRITMQKHLIDQHKSALKDRLQFILEDPALGAMIVG